MTWLSSHVTWLCSHVTCQVGVSEFDWLLENTCSQYMLVCKSDSYRLTPFNAYHSVEEHSHSRVVQ